MTALYKQAMSFSKMASTASWLMVGVGLYGNAKEIYQTCKMNDIISEACGRATTRNVTSGVFNATTGFSVGAALVAIPVTGGLSIVLVGAGSYVWGLYSSDISSNWGQWFEEQLFD